MEEDKLDHFLVIGAGYWGTGVNMKEAVDNASWFKPKDRVKVYRCTAGTRVNGMGGFTRPGGDPEPLLLGEATITAKKHVKMIHRLSRIHVNQHNIKANEKDGKHRNVLTVNDYLGNRKGNEIILRDSRGEEVARFVYRPDSPLPCGAWVWFETRLQVEVT